MLYICQFTTPNHQTYFWGPFKTKNDAQIYLQESRAQSEEYNSGSDPTIRLIRELHEPQETVTIDLDLAK